MDNDNKIVKYKGYIRKCAINILAWLENNPNPTEEKVSELIALKGQMNSNVFNYCENIFSYHENIMSGGWVKTKTILPTKVIEHNEWLEETQGVPADEDAIVGGN